MAQRPHPGRRAGRVRLVVGHRRPGRVPRPAGGPDVQALDGQGLELGPLLQRVALAAGEPELAWTSSSPFDHQDAAGALPDSVTHSEVLYNFVKPPIHGWALRQLRRAFPHLDREALARDVRRTARPGPGSGSTPVGSRPGPAALPARQRQRLGQRHHLRHRPGRSRRPTSPRFLVIAAAGARRPRHRARPGRGAGGLGDGTRPSPARAARRALGRRRFAAKTPRRARRTSRSLLDLMPIVLGADLPADVAEAWPAGSTIT